MALFATAVAAAVGLVLAGSAGSAPSKKTYTADFTPATVPGGTSTTVHLQIVNGADNQAIQSANVTAPSDFTITGVSQVVNGVSQDLNAESAWDDSQILLRSISIAQVGGTYDLDITVTTPCAADDYPWDIRAKQSNDFNGPPGNDFTLSGGNLVTTVAASALDHFVVTAPGGGNIPNQKAGQPFTVKATAYDTCGNVKSDYAGGATLSGTLSSMGVPPTYGAFGAWTNGSANASVTAVKAEIGVTLKATDSTHTGTSNAFDVTAGVPYSARFVQQPTDTQVDTAIFPPVTVEAKDQYGNLAGGYQLSLAITPGTGAAGATLTGGGPSVATATDGTGVATFDSLSIDTTSALKYTLDAQYAGAKLQTSASATSAPFTIADDVCSVTGGTCTVSGTYTAGGGQKTTADASATFDGSGSLALTFYTQGPTPDGCKNFIGTGSAGVDIGLRGDTGGFSVTYGLSDKALKDRYGQNYGQKNVPLCVGAQRIKDVDTGEKWDCKDDPAGGWTGKVLDLDGKPTGEFDTAECGGDGLWWNIAPNFQDPTSGLTDANGNSLDDISIVISGWGSSGSLRTFTVFVPSPWDWRMAG